MLLSYRFLTCSNVTGSTPTGGGGGLSRVWQCEYSTTLQSGIVCKMNRLFCPRIRKSMDDFVDFTDSLLDHGQMRHASHNTNSSSTEICR